MQARKFSFQQLVVQLVLIGFSFIVLYPIFIMIMTSLKSNMEIFQNPFGLPKGINFDGYINAFKKVRFHLLIGNSMIVTLCSLILIIATSVPAAYTFARLRFKFDMLLFFFFLVGIMIPIRMGILNLFNTLRELHLLDSLVGLILVYTAMGIPFAIFILTNFVKSIPKEIDEAARIDGCSDYAIITKIIVRLLSPAIATVCIFNFIPIWNDFYFPLIFLKDKSLFTIPLGMAQFFGQFQSDWTLVFSGLTLASIPTLLMYLLMSKQFIKGLTAGAVKG